MTEEEAINNIIKSCESMGWQIVMPKVDPESNVDGLVVGTMDFIKQTLPDEFEVDSIDNVLELEPLEMTIVEPKKLIGENPCPTEELRSGKYKTLSMSWDYDDDANDIEQRRAVLLPRYQLT